MIEKDSQRTLQILNEIEKDKNINQRVLSDKLGIALGLTNSCIKRCVKKGYIKVTTIPKNRIAYLITPKGFTEKAKLTYQYLQYTIHFYKETRKRIQDSLYILNYEGIKDIVFYGAGDVAEIAYISIHTTGLNLVAVADEEAAGDNFFGYTILGRKNLQGLDYDKIIITSFESSDYIYKLLIKDHIDKDKIFFIK